MNLFALVGKYFLEIPEKRRFKSAYILYKSFILEVGMKNLYRVIALSLIFLVLAGQYGFGAEEPVWDPSFVMAANIIAEEAAKLTGSIGFIGPIETPIGDESLSFKMIHMLESILQRNHRHVTLVNGDKAMRVSGIRPDRFVDAEIMKEYFPLLGVNYIIMGRLDNDGRQFRVYGYSSGGGSFTITDIPLERESIFKLYTDDTMPPIPNYKLVPLNGEVYDAAYDNTGDFAVVTTKSGGVFVYDTYRERQIKRIRDNGPVARVVYGPDGEILLAEETGVLRIITNEHAVEINAAESPLTAIECGSRRIYIGYNGGLDAYDLPRRIKLFSFERVSGNVKEMFLTGDEKIIIAHDSSGIGFFDASTGKRLGNIAGNFTAFAADTMGEFVAVAIKDKIHLYSATTKQSLGAFTFPGQPGSNSDVSVLRFSPQSNYLLAGNKAGLVMTFHVSSKLGMHLIESHVGPVSTARYRNDGGQFLSGGEDSQLFFYETQKEPSSSLRVISNVNENVAITINGIIPSEGANVPPRSTKIFHNIPLGMANILVQSPHNIIVASSGQRAASVNITKTGNTITLTQPATPALDIDDDGRIIATSVGKAPGGLVSIAYRAGEPTKSDSGYAFVVLLDLNTGLSTVLGAIESQHRKNINDSTWCGELFISAADDGLWLWKDSQPIVLDSQRTDNISVSTDGRYMVSSSSGADAKLWEREGSTFNFIQTIPGEKAMFHQDNSIISVKGRQVIRTTREGERLPVFYAESSEESVIFPQDIKSIRSGFGNSLLLVRNDNMIELRNSGIGTPLLVPGTIAVAQNAQTILAAQTNGDIIRFNAETGHREGTIFAHSREITDMIIFNENTLVTSSRDGSTKTFNIQNYRETGKFAIFNDRQKTFIKDGRFFGDTLHVLHNGRHL